MIIQLLPWLNPLSLEARQVILSLLLPPSRPFLGVWQDHAVLYQCVVGAQRLYTLLDGCYDTRQPSVQGSQVGLGQDRVNGVKGQGLS